MMCIIPVVAAIVSAVRVRVILHGMHLRAVAMMVMIVVAANSLMIVVIIRALVDPAIVVRGHVLGSSLGYPRGHWVAVVVVIVLGRWELGLNTRPHVVLYVRCMRVAH